MSAPAAPPQSPTPRVNLLPHDVTQSLRVTSILRRTMAAAVIIALVAGLAWWSAGPSIDSAASKVTDLQAQNARIQAGVEELAPVGTFYGQLERLEGLVSDTLASAPRAVDTLKRLNKAAASAGGIAFVKASLIYHGIPRAGDELNRCQTPNPFSERVTIGCIEFAATAQSRDEVAQFIAALEKDPLFIGPYVASTTADGNGSTITFTGSVGVSLDGLVIPLTDDSVIRAAQATADDSTSGEVAP